ncbi:VCBS repeat domain-containing M23 family metallopeptidase [Patescibacteria group bacterium]|nr:VCBS repeat domain-containing M23 family metallopeptidase [Patescibacteria group bacterium]
MKKLFAVLVIILLASIFLFSGVNSSQAADLRDIIFPVLGSANHNNDFGDPRSGGRTHKGNDIVGTKHQPLLAAIDGTITYAVYPEPSWGFMITIRDKDGYRYNYLHINDDNPGTDDGQGGGINAYAPDMIYGTPVVKGQIIAWMGDSGNAENTPPHVHFEIIRPDGNWIDPYPTLAAATHINRPVIPPALPNELLPYGEFKGGASIAYGNLDNTNTGLELVTGAGPGGGPQIRVYNENNKLLSQFFAFPENFRGGIDITTGDINGDGIDEIIVSAGPGGGPQIRAFKMDGTLMAQFFAYLETFRGGVKVASADLDGDGIDEIITGAGMGGGPHVRIFNRQGELQSQFFAYAPGFRGGIDVAAYEATNESPSVIVTAAGIGGGPHVRIFSSQGKLQNQFFAYAEGFRGGVNIEIANVDKSSITPEIATVPASGGGAHIRLFDYTGRPLNSFQAFETWWRGGYNLAAGDGLLSIVSLRSSRRTSIRSIVD